VTVILIICSLCIEAKDQVMQQPVESKANGLRLLVIGSHSEVNKFRGQFNSETGMKFPLETANSSTMQVGDLWTMGEDFKPQTTEELFKLGRPIWDRMTQLLEAGPRPVGLTRSKKTTQQMDGFVVLMTGSDLTGFTYRKLMEKAPSLCGFFDRHYPEWIPMPVEEAYELARGTLNWMSKQAESTAKFDRRIGFTDAIDELNSALANTASESGQSELKAEFKKEWEEWRDFFQEAFSDLAYLQKNSKKLTGFRYPVAYVIANLGYSLNNQPTPSLYDPARSSFNGMQRSAVFRLFCAHLVARHIKNGWRERFWIVQRNTALEKRLPKEAAELDPYQFSSEAEDFSQYPWYGTSMIAVHPKTMTGLVTAAFQKEARQLGSVQKAREEAEETKRNSQPHPIRQVVPMILSFVTSAFAEKSDIPTVDPNDEKMRKLQEIQKRRPVLPRELVPEITKFIHGRFS